MDKLSKWKTSKLLKPISSVLMIVFWLLLSAFTDNKDFINTFDFDQFITAYQAEGPSQDYKNWLGIEVEGYFSSPDKNWKNTFFPNKQDKQESKKSPFSNLTKLAKNVLEQTYGSEVSSTLSEQPDQFLSAILYNTNGVQKKIQFSDDSSIRNPADSKRLELISPIITEARDYKFFLEVLRQLSQTQKFTAEPLSAGTHLHFDFSYPNASEILLLTIILQQIESEMQSLFNMSTTRTEKHAKTYSLQDYYNLLKFLKSLEVQSDGRVYTNNLGILRSKSINWLSLSIYGTFEYRGFNSTVDPILLDIQVDLLKKIVQAVRLRDPRLIQYLKSKGIQKIRLLELAQILECKVASSMNQDYVYKKTRADLDYSLSIESKLQDSGILNLHTYLYTRHRDEDHDNSREMIRNQLIRFFPPPMRENSYSNSLQNLNLTNFFTDIQREILNSQASSAREELNNSNIIQRLNDFIMIKNNRTTIHLFKPNTCNLLFKNMQSL